MFGTKDHYIKCVICDKPIHGIKSQKLLNAHVRCGGKYSAVNLKPIEGGVLPKEDK